MRYDPCSAKEGEPHVMVDGAPRAATVLTLSHWPGTPTPPALRADLSAEIALRWRERPAGFPGAPLCTSDHLDQDGLVSLYALVHPVAARASWRRLPEVARTGDFATFAERGGARVSFALATLADAERSPLPAAWFAGTYEERTAALTTELLGRLPELVADPERHRELWAEEDDAVAAGEAAIAAGEVTIEEVPGLDLAVVEVPEDSPARLATRFCGRADAACHPAAVHNATTAGRVLTVQGRRYQLSLRYESWVRYCSRPVLPRVDLAPLAVMLSRHERNGARWFADGVASLVPRLRTEDGTESSLDIGEVRAVVEAHLTSAPPAWGPEGSTRLAPPAPGGR